MFDKTKLAILNAVKGSLDPFSSELTIRGLEVSICPTVDDCLELLINGCHSELFVLDVMIISKRQTQGHILNIQC